MYGRFKDLPFDDYFINQIVIFSKVDPWSIVVSHAVEWDIYALHNIKPYRGKVDYLTSLSKLS